VRGAESEGAVAADHARQAASLRKYSCDSLMLFELGIMRFEIGKVAAIVIDRGVANQSYG